MDWYIFSIIALFCYGGQYFLYKVSAEKKCNTAWTTFSFMITGATLSLILFFVFRQSINNLSLLLVLAILNAVSFTATTITRMETLKHLPISVGFPIIRLSTVLVVIFSVIYFKDKLSLYQILGIILAIVVVLILTKQEEQEKQPDKNFKLGLIFASIALITGAAATIVPKFAALSVNKLGFIVFSYFLHTLLALSVIKKLQTKRENPKQTNALIIGFFIGLINLLGFYMVLKALALGPLSLVASINSLAFVIAILLSILVYKEKLTRRRVLGIALAILAVILLRIY